MKIEFVEIQNFRKLKSCRVDFAPKETVFVGANNSGKTSAMDALILFLKEKSRFSTRDFTLSNWQGINAIGRVWANAGTDKGPDLSIDAWSELLPRLDVWIQVSSSEIHYVNHLIPTLDWSDGRIGIGLRLEPKNIENLYKEFHALYSASKNANAGESGKKKKKGSLLKLWPASMWDFLERRLHQHFEIRAYILDPQKLSAPDCAVAKPQTIDPANLPLEVAPLTGLIKIDIINAQRGFSDPNSEGMSTPKAVGNLSGQLREYYAKHLDPTDQPLPADIEALQAIEDARSAFDERLTESFSSSLKELEGLNYPGVGNPRINISSKVSAIDGLNHGSAVQFNLLKADSIDADYPLSLPEKYNGLGYQNLISMVFKLIRFRDDWMQVGKGAKRSETTEDNQGFEPLHLVLVEEPEAHLHAQVQQVFIRKAYEVLRNSDLLRDKTQFSTQMVVSTHSSHIAHEIDFTSLRYFRRKPALVGLVPTSCVVNLSETFGSEDDTTKFAIRYLKTTHCDLFFADAVILIEGPAERMLVPHFINKHYKELASCYLSILEIGGSHAHKLRTLVEALEIVTLVISDIDSVDPANRRTSVLPENDKGYITNNFTLSNWLPGEASLDKLMVLDEQSKLSPKFPIRAAYQIPLKVQFTAGNTEEVMPYTFEDSLVLENLELFKKLTGTGLVQKFNEAANKSNATEACTLMYEALQTGKKAEFALELLFLEDPEDLKVPTYIAEGLKWLGDHLIMKTEISLN